MSLCRYVFSSEAAQSKKIERTEQEIYIVAYLTCFTQKKIVRAMSISNMDALLGWDPATWFANPGGVNQNINDISEDRSFCCCKGKGRVKGYQNECNVCNMKL